MTVLDQILSEHDKLLRIEDRLTHAVMQITNDAGYNGKGVRGPLSCRISRNRKFVIWYINGNRVSRRNAYRFIRNDIELELEQ